MTSTDELKPCPFCGGKAFPNIDLRKHWIECRECCAESGCYRTEAEAIDAWNARAERTCRIVEYDEAPYPVCSECGAVQPDDYTVYYCWNCGAKVTP